jgi:ABC-type polysaccharide/polyol phosphate export permease
MASLVRAGRWAGSGVAARTWESPPHQLRRTAVRTLEELRHIGRYRDLLFELVRNDLIARYRRSFVGILWSILQPTARMLVILLAFSYLLGQRTPDYILYLFSGIVFWNFFGQAVTGGMDSLRANKGILMQLPVPMVLFPMATCLSGLINLCLMFVPLSLIMLFLGKSLTWAILFLPASILVALVFTFGVGLILGPLSIRFHDVIYLTQVMLQMLFYMVPIMYPISIVPERWRWVITYNPVGAVLEVFRGPLYYDAVPSLQHLMLAGGAALVLVGVGIVVMDFSRRLIGYYI